MIHTMRGWLDGARRMAAAPWSKQSPLRSELRKWKKQRARRRRLRDLDVCVVSYPKCGRTWLRVLVGKALCDKFHLDEHSMLDTWELTRTAGVLRTDFTHDGAEHQELRRYDELTTGKQDYRNTKVIFLIRDPRDVVVSSYFQATRRSGVFDGTLSEFIRSDRHGIRKIVAFISGWYENRQVPAAWLLLRYEDLRADAHRGLRSVLDFMDAHSVDDATVDEAVRFSQFENMKKLESAGHFSSRDLGPAQEGDAESYKVRKGKVGGYRDYMTAEDIEYVEQVMAELRCPVYCDRRANAA